MANGFSWFNLFLIIIIIIIIIAAVIIFSSHRNSLTLYGVAYVIQTGPTSGSTDTMVLDGNKMYIAQTNQPLTLTLNKNSNHLKGRVVGIKNNTTASQIKLKAGTIRLDASTQGENVIPGHTAYLIATDNNASWLRLQ